MDNESENNKTEHEYNELAKHFRTIVLKKDKKIKQLSKNICLLYGLVRGCHEHFADGELLEMIRTYCSQFVEELMGYDEE